MKPKERTVVLWFFGIVLALLPLWFDHMHERFGGPPSWASVIMHGELLLVSLAILGDAIGRAATSDDDLRVRSWLLLASVFAAVAIVYDIGEIRARVANILKIAENSELAAIITKDSLIGFAASMLLSFTTVVSLED